MIFTTLRIQTEPLYLFSIQVDFKLLDCFLEVIKSRMFKGFRLTLLTQDFLRYSGPGRGCRYHPSIKSVTGLLDSQNVDRSIR